MNSNTIWLFDNGKLKKKKILLNIHVLFLFNHDAMRSRMQLRN